MRGAPGRSSTQYYHGIIIVARIMHTLILLSYYTYLAVVSVFSANFTGFSFVGDLDDHENVMVFAFGCTMLQFSKFQS